MNARHSFFSILVATFLSGFAFSAPDNDSATFTLQVAAFSEADESRGEAFLNQLAEAGEQPIWGMVEIPGRGNWMRVYVGSFKNQLEAKQYGEKLVQRNLIKEFIIKKVSEIKTLSRPRSVIRKDPVQSKARPPSPERPPEPPEPTRPLPSALTTLLAHPPINQPPATLQHIVSENAPATLRQIATIPYDSRSEDSLLPEPPSLKTQIINLAPSLNAEALPRTVAAQIAINLITGKARPESPGGLWLSGDTREGMARLRWVLGKDAELLDLNEDNQVVLDWQRLYQIAHLEDRCAATAPLLLLDYIIANEGLRLLVQLTNGEAHYLFHIGGMAPTLGGDVAVTGSLNLDSNFDSRINPYRRNRRKLDVERPPSGFDCLIALNPLARWFNLQSRELVQVGNITFHELAEAYAKVESGYEYLPKNNNPGAHNIALTREIKLKEQRSEVVLTLGSNRVLRTEEELQRIYAEIASGQQQ